jgi:hypothetical protein
MELKHVRLLSLSILLIHSASAVSINDVLDQILAYPLSLFQPVPATPLQGQDPTTSPSGAHADRATFPCCICSGCICSHTSCPEIVVPPFPSPPEANWPITSGTPKEIAAAGCGAAYGVDACLSFIQQYLQALQPALELASNHSHSHYGDSEDSEGKKKKKKTKQPCCGDGCTDTQCLSYLATAVKNLQAPINGTLESMGDSDGFQKKKQKPVSGTGEGVKAEL